MIGTESVFVPAFWKSSVTLTNWPPPRLWLRFSSTTSGCGPLSSTDCCLPSLTPPAGSRTEEAAPGADTLTSRSGAPLLASAKNSPAVSPADSVDPGTGPSTNMLLTLIELSTSAEAPGVGWCQDCVG